MLSTKSTRPCRKHLPRVVVFRSLMTTRRTLKSPTEQVYRHAIYVFCYAKCSVGGLYLQTYGLSGSQKPNPRAHRMLVLWRSSSSTSSQHLGTSKHKTCLIDNCSHDKTTAFDEHVKRDVVISRYRSRENRPIPQTSRIIYLSGVCNCLHTPIRVTSESSSITTANKRWKSKTRGNRDDATGQNNVSYICLGCV